MKSILITGGVRSGKSSFAQELAMQSAQPVLFVATAEAGDEEMQQRIEEHKKARPTHWSTLEVTNHIGSQITQKLTNQQTVIVDCITLLVSNILNQHTDPHGSPANTAFIEREVMAEIDELIDCINRVKASFIIVTNEVGLGLVPANRIGRLYRDLLGKANQMLAQQADKVHLIVAGLPTTVKHTKEH